MPNPNVAMVSVVRIHASGTVQFQRSSELGHSGSVRRDFGETAILGNRFVCHHSVPVS